MQRTTPKQASDAYVASIRAVLQCIAPVELIHSGWALGISNSLRVVPSGRGQPDVIVLRRSDRTVFLHTKIALEYVVALGPEASRRSIYQVSTTRYIYRVLDLSNRELIAFHWHPVGVSDVYTPHLHVSAVPTIRIPTATTAPSGIDLHLNKVHFPTHQIGVVDFVGFLIRELGVAPRRTDWESVLDRVSQ